MAIPTDAFLQPTDIGLSLGLGIDLYPIARGTLLVFLFFYLVLLLMVIKQVNMMGKTIHSGGSKSLVILAYLQLFILILTLLFTLFYL